VEDKEVLDLLAQSVGKKKKKKKKKKKGGGGGAEPEPAADQESEAARQARLDKMG